MVDYTVRLVDANAARIEIASEELEMSKSAILEVLISHGMHGTEDEIAEEIREACERREGQVQRRRCDRT